MHSVITLQLKFQNVLQSPKLNSSPQPSGCSMFPHSVAQSRDLSYAKTTHHQNLTLSPQKCRKFAHVLLTLDLEPVSSHLDYYKLLMICWFAHLLICWGSTSALWILKNAIPYEFHMLNRQNNKPTFTLYYSFTSPWEQDCCLSCSLLCTQDFNRTWDIIKIQ